MNNLFGLENYYYHGSVRRYVALFGSLFSDLYLKRIATDGSMKEDTIKVPIRYSNGNMYMKVPQDASREINQISRTLPAIAFSLDNIYRDKERKTNPNIRIPTATFQNDPNGPESRTFQLNRIPYNFIFSLMIRTKNTDDMLQLTEQIIPAFDGNLSVTVQDTTGINIEQDIIIVLQDVKMSDNFDDEMQSRLVEWTITFELKGYLYKKTQTGLIIKEVDLYSGTTLDNMTLIETTDNQGETQDDQLLLSKMTEVMDKIPSKPVAKKTRRKRKQEEV